MIFFLRWFFGAINPSEAEERLLVPGIPSGSFLIHTFSTPLGYRLVLSLRFEDEVPHHLIFNATVEKTTVFFINQEAPFRSLAQLVYHYSQHADGLVCKLTQPYGKAKLQMKSRHSCTDEATGREQGGEGNSHAVCGQKKHFWVKNETSSPTMQSVSYL